MMSETFMILVGAVFVSGLIAELLAVALAPVGYQDDHGFHTGDQNSEASSEQSWENPS